LGLLGLGRRRRDVVQPHVGHQIAIVLVGVAGIEGQYRRACHFLPSKEGNHLGSLRIGGVVVHRSAIRERACQRGLNVSLGGLRLLDAAGVGVGVAGCRRTNLIVGVRDMRQQLAQRPDLLGGLEAVEVFRDLFRGGRYRPLRDAMQARQRRDDGPG
jgi:hypothetical protein